MMTNRLTQEQKEANRQAKADLLASLTENDKNLLAKYDATPLERWSLRQLQAGVDIIRYDQTHPDRFKPGPAGQALKELYGEV